jgi:hypothetical protein
MTAKYRNKKTTIDGITFDSKAESRRWLELKLLEKAGVITKLERQVKYVLIPSQKREDGTTERECYYKADFDYWQDGKHVVEDVKGVKTAEYIVKRKLMLDRHLITIKEVI